MPATIYVVLASFAGVSGDNTPYLIEKGSKLRFAGEEADGLIRVDATRDDFISVHPVSVLWSDLKTSARKFVA